ncbi:hypothetical protein G6F70_006714 [Rhizopus microsporus]|nr:hypothetical protein G6F71_002386 [Rhizopus microsporus]KAG1197330.1 hypothetical protein G6F70_006714 [Rhizopus microsporus]KAG1208296.1 hypothetical protein G6F69_007345 [Rhizopus microsporus]KAG1229637.1 hypothetical protein G6F67_007014 [Rhizopus microsporus]KAG1261594.1 hypothetical protein G6F68_006566 [Rhizopus microsporus]
MGNKTVVNDIVSLRFSKPHHADGVRKKVHNAKPSRVGKKTREAIKKNFAFIANVSSISTLLKSNSAHSLHYIKSGSIKSFPSEEEEQATHSKLTAFLGTGLGMNAYPDCMCQESNAAPMLNIDHQPKTWRDGLSDQPTDALCFTAKQARYQELVYEIITTEQVYVDDLILIHEIFIKDALEWGGLLFPVERLFKSIKSITELHWKLHMLPKLELYFSYFRDFERANALIQESIRCQDEFGSFIQRRSAWSECKSLPMSAYLLKPIQRIMKYPLFFKSLSECLDPNDTEASRIAFFLEELDKLLRNLEQERKEAEEFLKLEDLSSRIKGLEGSTIHIAEPKRKLIYEGYLTIIPCSNQQQLLLSKMSSSTISFASTAETPKLRRRNSTFNISSRKHDRAYVFLFNDLIVCTRERSRKRSLAVDERGFAIMPSKGSYYGPSPDSLFEIIHSPGKLTMVNRHVTRETSPVSRRPSRKGSTFFQSLRRYGNRIIDEDASTDTLDPPSPLSLSQHSLSFLSPEVSQPSTEEHPLQFICSIATRNLTNITFEAETEELKNTWCDCLESVLKEHVQREDIIPQSIGQLTPIQIPDTAFSIESSSSPELLEFSITSDTSEDVRDMEVDMEHALYIQETEQSHYKHLRNEPLPSLINRLNSFDNDDFYNTLLNDFSIPSSQIITSEQNTTKPFAQ